MNQFKIGDYITCIQDISSWVGGPTSGQVFKVIGTRNDDGYEWIGIHCPNLGSTYNEDRRLGTYANWSSDCFRLAESHEVNNLLFPQKLESIINDD